MVWETPELVEIKMDAEISAYQEDTDGGPLGRDPMKPLPPRVEREQGTESR
jgi:hypothetical protein